MSFDKAILFKKTKRKPYRKSKAVSRRCRNHGGCSYCLQNRMHSDNIRKKAALDQVNDALL